MADLNVLYSHKLWAEKFDRMFKVCSDGGTILVCGDRGNGKTQAAVEVVRWFCKEGLSCRYVRARQIGMELRRSYGPERKVTEDQAIKAFTKPHLMVVDEVQERPDSDYEIRTFTLIMDLRYSSVRPTILIANYDPMHIEDILSSSIRDRINEGGGVITFDWPSFRTP